MDPISENDHQLPRACLRKIAIEKRQPHQTMTEDFKPNTDDELPHKAIRHVRIK